MNTDFDLLSLAEARRLRDEGMQRAAGNSPSFVEFAYAALERIARRQIHVYTDDLLKELGDVRPTHPNAFGTVWRQAIQKGLLQRTNQCQASADPLKHGHLYPIYFSRVYDPTRARQ